MNQATENLNSAEAAKNTAEKDYKDAQTTVSNATQAQQSAQEVYDQADQKAAQAFTDKKNKAAEVMVEILPVIPEQVPTLATHLVLHRPVTRMMYPQEFTLMLDSMLQSLLEHLQSPAL